MRFTMTAAYVGRAAFPRLDDARHYGERMRMLWAALRIVFAVAIAAAIVFQLAATVGKATADGRSAALVITNFFSYFTIESNGLAVVVLLIGAVLLIRRPGDDPQWFSTLRLSMTTYMVVTGIVYNLLLRN